MLEGFAGFCRGVGGEVGLDPKSDSPQSSSSSGITGGFFAGGGGGAGLDEVEAGASKSQSNSSCFCSVVCFGGGGVNDNVVPRESKPTQADD